MAGPATTAITWAVPSVSVGCAMTSSSPTAATITPATITTMESGGRRSGDHDRLAEGDDHEQLEALGEMSAVHLPGHVVEPRPAGHAVDEQRAGVVDRQRDEPQDRARGAVRDAAREPEHCRRGEPRQDL